MISKTFDVLYPPHTNPPISASLASAEDAAEADRTFDMLMGDAVDPRKRFIQTHAKAVRNLDI
jgi:DNA gyrase/topoisomerase IV subunit B